MPPPKRRTKAGQAVHDGRVTRPKSVEPAPPPPSELPLTPPPHPRGSGRPTPAPSSRYTPPVSSLRLRPEWHKLAGVASILLGFGLFFVCQLNIGGIHDYGGHVWYIPGLAIAASSTWWFGWFDRRR